MIPSTTVQEVGSRSHFWLDPEIALELLGRDPHEVALAPASWADDGDKWIDTRAKHEGGLQTIDV